MSTDLEFFQDSAKIRLPKLKIQSSNENGIGIQEENKNENECITTPTSKENMIPAALSCPGAPKKPRKTAVPCKRKLSEDLQFFEIVNRDEVDEFFKAGFHGSISKRRCPCT